MRRKEIEISRKREVFTRSTSQGKTGVDGYAVFLPAAYDYKFFVYDDNFLCLLGDDPMWYCCEVTTGRALCGTTKKTKKGAAELANAYLSKLGVDTWAAKMAEAILYDSSKKLPRGHMYRPKDEPEDYGNPAYS